MERANPASQVEGTVKITVRSIGCSASTSKAKAYLEKVSQRSRRDYERTMLLITDMVTKKGDRVGDRRIKSDHSRLRRQNLRTIIAGSARAATASGRKGCWHYVARAWSVVHRLYPTQFDQAVPNPWRGVTKNRRTKAVKPAATPRAGLHFCQRQRSRLGTLKQPQPRSSASNGCSVRRMSWRATCDGQIIAAGMAEGDQDLSPQDRRRCTCTRSKNS